MNFLILLLVMVVVAAAGVCYRGLRRDICDLPPDDPMLPAPGRRTSKPTGPAALAAPAAVPLLTGSSTGTEPAVVTADDVKSLLGALDAALADTNGGTDDGIRRRLRETVLGWVKARFGIDPNEAPSAESREG